MAILKRASTLADCEGRIEGAIEAAKEHFWVIGNQLAIIRDNVLYTDDTFEAYVERRWDYSRSYAYRLINAAGIVGNLEAAGVEEKPETERQARAVGEASSDPAEQAEVWMTAQEIAGNDQPTADVIEQAAEIVETGTPINHESLEIDEAIAAFAKLQKKLIKAGQRIQAAFDAKVKVSAGMSSRQVKFRNLVDGLASRTDLLREDIEDLSAKWTSTKKQVDDK